VPVSFSAEERDLVEQAAKAKNQSVSEWITDAIEVKICRTLGDKPNA
jgi:hypothetical protein